MPYDDQPGMFDPEVARYRSQMNAEGMQSLAWLLHILRGGAPSRDLSAPPPAMPGPGMLGPVNGAFPAGPAPDRRLPSHAMTVRG